MSLLQWLMLPAAATWRTLVATGYRHLPLLHLRILRAFPGGSHPGPWPRCSTSARVDRNRDPAWRLALQASPREILRNRGAQ